MEQPKLNFFHVCEYASLGENKKLNILGIFKSINAPSEPITHGLIAFVLNVAVHEIGEHKIEIKLFKSSDKTKKLIAPKFEFSPRVESLGDGTSSEIGIVAQMTNVQFPEFGEYIVQASVDGFDVAIKSISVVRK